MGLDLAHALLCAIDNTAALLLMSLLHLLLLNCNPVMMMMVMMMMVAPTLGMMIARITTGIISTGMSLDPPLPPRYSFEQLCFFTFVVLLLFLITILPTRSVLDTLLECPFGVVVYLYLLNESNHVWWLRLLQFVYHV